jgi:hypothetical protein
VPSLIETVNQITNRILEREDLNSVQKNELANDWMSKVLFNNGSKESSDVYRQIFKNYKDTIDENNLKLDKLRTTIQATEFRLSYYTPDMIKNSELQRQE